MNVSVNDKESNGKASLLFGIDFPQGGIENSVAKVKRTVMTNNLVEGGITVRYRHHHRESAWMTFVSI